MDDMTIKFYWLILGGFCSLIVGVTSFTIRNAITKNATKENVEAKTDLLEKDIEHIRKEMETCKHSLDVMHKRITDLRDHNADIYVSKEMFEQSMKQFNDKLDTILKFVKRQ